MENPFESKWESVESAGPRPYFVRDIKTVRFDDFKRDVFRRDPKFVDSFVKSLYAGDAYILRDAFDPGSLRTLRDRVHAWGRQCPASSHRIIDGCPNYHEMMKDNVELPGRYCAVDHSHYFFRWNPDSLNLFRDVEEQWKVFKIAGGFDESIYKNNIPSTGLVDRIQIIHYPSGAGKITPHCDPSTNQKSLIGAMLTEPGKDYQSGGFFLLTADKERCDVEDQMELGSMITVYPSMYHGVDVIDPATEPDWSSNAGRWYMALFSVESHYSKERETALPPPPSILA